MELTQCIKDRRSIRAFKDEPVSKEVVEDILYYGTLAPSGKNRQPWRMVVATGDTKTAIADLMIKYTIEHDESIDEKAMKAKSSVNPTANVINEAPVLVLIFREPDLIWTVSDSVSIGACAQNMCLRALEHGLGTLIIRDTWAVAEDIAKLVGLPDMQLSTCVSIGVPNQNPPARPRKSVEEMVTWM